MKKQKYKMQEIYQGLYDGPHATPPVSDSGAIFLGISNITSDGHIDYSDIRYINEIDLPKWTKRVTPKGGDIVFSYEATLNLYAIIPEGFWGCLGRRMALIRPDESKALGKYLYYYFYSDEWRATIAENTIAGSTVDRIPIAKFPEFPITLPDLSVQKKIADTLSVYDDLIDNNQKQIKLLEEAAQRLYKEWFVDLRFPGYEKMDIVDGMPEKWKTETIGELCKRINAGGTPNRSKKDYWDEPSIKWFKTGELQDCWLIDSDEMISIAGLEGSSAKLFPPNTILMAIYASPTLGRLGVLTSEAACNQAALCMLADESKVSWQWLYYKLSELRDYFNSVAKGAGQQNISTDTVKKKEIVLPEKKTIDQFSKIISPLLDKRLCLQKENKTLSEARDRLLPKLMSGEIEL